MCWTLNGQTTILVVWWCSYFKCGLFQPTNERSGLLWLNQSERWILRFSIKRQLGSKVGGRRWVKHIPGRFAPEGGDDAAATDSRSWKLAVHHCKDSLPAVEEPKLIQIRQSFTNKNFGGFIAIYTVYYPTHWPLLFFASFLRVFSRPRITIVMEFRSRV